MIFIFINCYVCGYVDLILILTNASSLRVAVGAAAGGAGLKVVDGNKSVLLLLRVRYVR